MGMPRTNTEPFLPDVTTYWPTFTFSFLSTYSSVTSPVTLPLTMPWALPSASPGSIMASTKLCWSVTSMTCAAFAIDLGDAADEALAVDHRVVHL